MELLWNLDQNLFRWINQECSNDFLDVFFRLATYLGVGTVQVALLLPLLARRATRSMGTQALLSWLFAGAFNLYLKSTILRHRPSNLVEAFVPEDERIYLSSFASGHTTTAFAVATTLLLALPPRHRWIGWLSIVLALLVGISRIYRGVHWPTDVIAAAAAGIAWAILVDLVYTHMKKREQAS